MNQDENTISQLVQMQAKHYGCTLMRNNSGCFKDDTGRLVRFGLGNISKKHNDVVKSSDLVGITKVTITQDMVGTTLGVFTALEVKKEAWNPDKKLDKRETAQNNFMNWVKLNGGFASFVNSIDKLKDILRQ